MANHRYWRLFVSATNGGASVAINEITMATSPGGGNVATGGTASASSTSGANVASQAFDTILTSANGWRSASTYSSSRGTEWIQYDFGGSPQDIAEITLHFAPAGTFNVNEAPNSFILYYSDDGIVWTRQRAWEGYSFIADETKTLDATELSSSAIYNRQFTKNLSLRYNDAATSQTAFARADTVYRNTLTSRGFTTAYVYTIYTGAKRIAGTTTLLGDPVSRRVLLMDQKTGLLIASQQSAADGTYEFAELSASHKYSVIGVDVTEQENSVIWAHVEAVD